MSIQFQRVGFLFLLLLMVLPGCKPAGARHIDRRTFAMTVPEGWTEDKNDSMYDANGFVMFENKDSCLFIVFVTRKTKAVTVDTIVEKQRQAYLKKMTDTKAGAFVQWSRYKGKGLRLVGKVNGAVPFDNRIFAFENGTNVCSIVEAATPDDFNKYGRDYDQIRQSFVLK